MSTLLHRTILIVVTVFSLVLLPGIRSESRDDRRGNGNISQRSYPIKIAFLENIGRTNGVNINFQSPLSGVSLFGMQDDTFLEVEKHRSMARAQDIALISFIDLHSSYFSGDQLSIAVAVETQAQGLRADLYAAAWTPGLPGVLFFTGDPIRPFASSPAPVRRNIPLGSQHYQIYQGQLPAFSQGFELRLLAVLMEPEAPLTADYLLSNIAEASVRLIGIAQNPLDRNQSNSLRILRDLVNPETFQAKIKKGALRRLDLDLSIPRSLLPANSTEDDVALAILSASQNLLRVETLCIACLL